MLTHVSKAPRSVVLAREAYVSPLQAALPKSVVVAKSTAELYDVARTSLVAFVDVDLLANLDPAQLRLPVIGISDGKPGDTLTATVSYIGAFPWLSHVVSASLLATPHAATHFERLIERLQLGSEQADRVDAVGRVALLARASRRQARFERIQEFFSKQGLTDRTIGLLLDVAEELAMNALYDAPAEAGFFTTPRQRNEDVELPAHRACEISYGMEHDTAFVRVRDPFGALSRNRLVQVLQRCSSKAVGIDDSRGGAGLGLWRVFTNASAVAITVIPGSLTEVHVRLRIQNGRAATKQVEAIHLFFPSKSEYYESLALIPEDDHAPVDHSVTLIRVA